MILNDVDNVAFTRPYACHVYCCITPPPPYVNVQARLPKTPGLGHFFL